MSRPPRSPHGELATKAVTVRLTPTEYTDLQQRKGQLSWSEFLRRAAHHQPLPRSCPRPPVPAVNRQTYIELGRIGNNLNQLTRACHRAQHQGEALPISPATLSALITQLQQLRLALLGIEPDAEADETMIRPS